MESLKDSVEVFLKPLEEGFIIESEHYGRKSKSFFNQEMAQSLEWKRLRELSQTLKSFCPLPLKLLWKKEDKKEESFASYEAFYDRLISEARKGVLIQRYKGLGEMNPDQLWDTTLNRENRRLIRVTLEDSMKADETFSVLMGEMVEPRKRFIYENALRAGDLDI